MLPAAWRYRRFHTSVLLAWLSLGLLVGLFAGRSVPMFFAWAVIVFVAVLVATSLKSKRWYACLVLVIAGGLLGGLRASLYATELQHLSSYGGSTVTLNGTLQQDPTLATNGSNVWQAELSGIQTHSRFLRGNIYATIVSDTELKRGDIVTVKGKMLEGFGSFQGTMYRAELVSVTRPKDPFLAARDSFAAAVRTVMPEPEASLGLGFVVGQKSALPDDLAEQLKTVGLTHIVVASGYNLTILVRFARRLLARRSRYLALAGSIALVLGFILVSGFSASMNRAAVVTVLSLLAWYYGRKFHPVQLIAYVAAVSAFFNPQYVWGDLGWLLSFAAFTGILVIAPIATRVLYAKGREPGAATRLVIETLSAEIMTLPILIVSFGYVPVLALLANVLVAPVIPAAMLFTFIAGVVGWVAPWLTLLAYPATILIAYVVAIVEKLANVDWARISVTVTVLFAVAWYVVLAGASWSVWRRRKVDLLAQSVVE
jgi:competence protein ComEC